MRDEEYLFHQDVREKKHTGYSARKQRSHCGKAGCKLPSDYLTKKEKEKMNGECKSYRLNEPMKWREFLAMPDEHKITYIKLLRQKYNVPGRFIAEMLGTNQPYYTKEMQRLGLSLGKNCRGGRTVWDRDGWFAWSRGIPVVVKEEEHEEAKEEQAVEIPVEEVVQEDISPEEAEEILEIIGEKTPLVDECPYKEIPNPGIKVNLIREVVAPAIAVPKSGNMSFEGSLPEIVNTLEVLLGNRNVKFAVRWEVVE